MWKKVITDVIHGDSDLANGAYGYEFYVVMISLHLHDFQTQYFLEYVLKDVLACLCPCSV